MSGVSTGAVTHLGKAIGSGLIAILLAQENIQRIRGLLKNLKRELEKTSQDYSIVMLSNWERFVFCDNGNGTVPLEQAAWLVKKLGSELSWVLFDPKNTSRVRELLRGFQQELMPDTVWTALFGGFLITDPRFNEKNFPLEGRGSIRKLFYELGCSNDISVERMRATWGYHNKELAGIHAVGLYLKGLPGEDLLAGPLVGGGIWTDKDGASYVPFFYHDYEINQRCASLRPVAGDFKPSQPIWMLHKKRPC